MTIWKFPFSVEDVFSISMPKGAMILSVQMQGGVPCMWAFVDPDAPQEKRIFTVYGTGHPCGSSPDGFIGTFQMTNRQLVFHLFEEKV